MKDVVETNGQMEMVRNEVATIWACIRPQTSAFSAISQYGYSSTLQPTQPSHKVFIRRKSYLDISNAAWVYEHKRVTSQIWYKVVGYYLEDEWLVLAGHLHERSDGAQPPKSALMTPQQVKVPL
jgi:hypothetical protein